MTALQCDEVAGGAVDSAAEDGSGIGCRSPVSLHGSGMTIVNDTGPAPSTAGFATVSVVVPWSGTRASPTARRCRESCRSLSVSPATSTAPGPWLVTIAGERQLRTWMTSCRPGATSENPTVVVVQPEAQMNETAESPSTELRRW